MLFVLFSQRDYLSLVYYINYINSHHTPYIKTPKLMLWMFLCRSIERKHFILFFDTSEFAISDASKCADMCIFPLELRDMFDNVREILFTSCNNIIYRVASDFSDLWLIKHTRCERTIMKSWIMMFIIYHIRGHTRCKRSFNCNLPVCSNIVLYTSTIVFEQLTVIEDLNLIFFLEKYRVHVSLFAM